MKKQLEDAARNYYLTLEKAYATNDPTPLASLRTETCICKRVEDSIRQASVEGLRIRVDYVIVSTSAHGALPTSGEVTLSYRAPLNDVVDATGKVVEKNEPVKDGIKEMSFARVDNRWLVSHIISYKLS